MLRLSGLAICYAASACETRYEAVSAFGQQRQHRLNAQAVRAVGTARMARCRGVSQEFRLQAAIPAKTGTPTDTTVRTHSTKFDLSLVVYLLVWSLSGYAIQNVAAQPAPLESSSPARVEAKEASATTVIPAETDGQRRAELRRVLEKNAPIIEAQAAVLKAATKLIAPSVVHIEADVPQRTLEHSRDRQVEEAGAGVIIERGGKYYVLTNRHVFRDATPEDVRIHLADGRQLHPKRILDDSESDVGVLGIEADNLLAATVGDSDRMDVGDFVLAFGSPFGLSRTVTFGIISGKGRRDLRLGDAYVRFQDFLQTDAAINPGNSGGPLCNIHGEVIGINTAIASNSGTSEGVGFSIPSKMFMSVAKQLIDHGKVTRAFLGLSLDAKFGPAAAAEIGLPRPTGARINGLTKGAPAEVAGLQVGDVVLKFDGTAVEDDSHLVNLVGLTEIGRKVNVEIYRDGKRLVYNMEAVDRSRFGQ
jgi:serine protease Do